MDKEIKDLTQQRDLAQSRLDDLFQSGKEHQVPQAWIDPGQQSAHNGKIGRMDKKLAFKSSDVVFPAQTNIASSRFYLPGRCDSFNFSQHDLHLFENSEDQFLYDGTSPSLNMNKYFGIRSDSCWDLEKIAPQTGGNLEDSCKELQCVAIEPCIDTYSESHSTLTEDKGDGNSEYSDQTCEALKLQSHEIQETEDGLVNYSQEQPSILEGFSFPSPEEVFPSSFEEGDCICKKVKQNDDAKSHLQIEETAPDVLESDLKIENLPTDALESDSFREPEVCELEHNEQVADSISENLQKKASLSFRSVSRNETRSNMDESGQSDASGVDICFNKPNGVVKHKPQEQFGDDTEAEPKSYVSEVYAKGRSHLSKVNSSPLPNSDWPSEFEKQRKDIIELWDACFVPLVHRTYFFFLFKGDPSDSVYLEVELRRLTFLKQMLDSGTKVVKDGKVVNSASSTRALHHEREMLSRKMEKLFSTKERDELYLKWDIKQETKQRKRQLCRKLWTNANDIDHITESAALVAKLVGFTQEVQAAKEMFGLSFLPGPCQKHNSMRDELST